MNINRLINLARLEAGSYKKIAEILDTSNVRVSHWNHGRNEPSTYEIFRMAEIAGLEPISTFYEVMIEIDKEHAEYWCTRRDSNARPSASETVTKQYSVTEVYNLVSGRTNAIPATHSDKLSIMHARTALLITICYIVGFTKSFLLLQRTASSQGVHSASY